MSKLLLATTNPGKILEMKAILGDLDVDLLDPFDIGLELDVVEDGETYADNAARKALAYSHASGLLTLADDSGLEVDALGGLPGIRSHRLIPQADATDADRRAALLQRLQGFPRPWTARFHCTVALALPSGEVRFADGECPGEIIPQERGANGFGYDPIFLIPSLGRTMAELELEEKNRLSHRARALTASRPVLAELLSGGGGL
jgi:XTP/dITP diphosphohydrolase